MSDHYVGLNRGQSGFADSDFTLGTSTGSTDVEVRIADAAGLTRQDVEFILQAIVRRIQSGGLADLLTSGRV